MTFVSSSLVICTLPTGAGVGLPVLAADGPRVSVVRNLLSYGAPEIDTILRVFWPTATPGETFRPMGHRLAARRGRLLGVDVELGMPVRVHVRLHTRDRLGLADQPLVGHVHRDADGGLGGALWRCGFAGSAACHAPR